MVAAAVARLGRSAAPTADSAPSRAPIKTIAILFQQSGYRTFKAFSTQYVQQHLRGEFPHLVSYSRFVEPLPTVLAPLIVYVHTQLCTCTGVSFIDSTALAICKKPPRQPRR